MGKRKKTTMDIYQLLAENGAVTVDKGVEILKKYKSAPDPAKLEEQYWKAQFRRVMKSKHDEVGVSDVYSDGKGTYYDVPVVINESVLQDIDKQITTQVKRLMKARRKVKARQLIVSEQLALEFCSPNNEIENVGR